MSNPMYKRWILLRDGLFYCTTDTRSECVQWLASLVQDQKEEHTYLIVKFDAYYKCPMKPKLQLIEQVES